MKKTVFVLFLTFLLAIFWKVCYTDSMRTTFLQYLSRNGIRYHHSLSTFQEGETEEVHPESHAMCEIFLLLSGKVEYHIDGKIYTPKPMELLIVAPNELHQLKADTSQPYERMVVHFLPNLLPSLLEIDLLAPIDYAKHSARIIPKEIVEKFGLYENILTFKQLCSQKGKYLDLRLVGAIITLIEALNESVEAILSSDTSSLPTPQKINAISHACIQYINSHITQQISAEDLSKHLNLSVSYIRNSFKKEIGIPLQHYIHHQKMQLARTLLTQGQSPQQVANALGFEYYSTFYQSYMKCFELNPKVYFNLSNQNLSGIETDPI